MILYHVQSGSAKIKIYAKNPKQAAHSILNMQNLGSFVTVNENDIIEENREDDIYFSINSLTRNENTMKLVY